MKKTFSTKNISGIAVFSALSFIVYIFDFPIFPSANFLKLDFSNVFVMLGGFMFGPLGGIIILTVKELIHLFIGNTGGIGEFVNIIIGVSYIIIPSTVYRKRKGIKAVLITMLIGCVVAVIVSLALNKYVNFPLYNKLFGIYEYGVTFDNTFWILVAFNSIKYVAVSILTFALYKKLSALFKKINLREKEE